MLRIPRTTGLLAALVIVTGCGGEAPPPEPGEADLDRLRALPYLDAAAPAPEHETPGVALHDPRRASSGYTLITTQMLSRADLIDGTGEVLRTWQHSPPGRWDRAVLLPGGDLVAIGADPSGRQDKRIPDATRYVLRYDWEGNLLWKRHLTVHHDVVPVPGGDLLALGFRRRSIPAIHPEIDIRDDQLMLLDGNGQVRQTRSLLDAFVGRPDLHRMRPKGLSDLGVEQWIDLFHANSVQRLDEPLFGSGDVLVSSRHQDCIAVLNWESGRLLWTWGPGELSGPHDARLLDNGHILVFDNGIGREWSRVIEVDPASGEIVWEYRAPEPTDFYTLSKGSNQRLPNGNTLIANSDNGIAFEVTRAGEVVWEFRNPHRDSLGRRAAIVRATRHPEAFIAEIRAQGRTD
jgi:hypothetical protein